MITPANALTTLTFLQKIVEWAKSLWPNNLYRGFFDLSPTMFIVMKKDGTIKKVNRAFSDALGYKISDMEGKKLMSFVDPPNHRETIVSMWLLREGATIMVFRNDLVSRERLVVKLDWASAGNGLIYSNVRVVKSAKRKAQKKMKTVSEITK